MVWNKSTITNAGLSLIARAETYGEQLVITNCKLSSHDYSNLTIGELKLLSDIEDVEQTKEITDKKITDISKVQLSSNFDNSQLTVGYDLFTYGVYGHIGEEDEVLILIATSENSEKVPALNDGLWQTLINSVIPISTTDNITINVDYAATATKQWVEDFVNSQTIVTIPAEDPEDSPYTEETDSDSNTYYTIEIPVAGMTSEYKGTRDMKPVYPRPYNVEQKDVIDSLFELITDGDSLDGKIKLYLSDKPESSFQVYLYGV